MAVVLSHIILIWFLAFMWYDFSSNMFICSVCSWMDHLPLVGLCPSSAPQPRLLASVYIVRSVSGVIILLWKSKLFKNHQFNSMCSQRLKQFCAQSRCFGDEFHIFRLFAEVHKAGFNFTKYCWSGVTTRPFQTTNKCSLLSATSSWDSLMLQHFLPRSCRKKTSNNSSFQWYKSITATSVSSTTTMAGEFFAI